MKLIIALLLCFLIIKPAFAQIVDDSSKLAEGYKTTIYRLYSSDVLDSIGKKLDTSIINFQEKDEWLWVNGRQKNLGFIGSPQNPLFAQFNPQIGLQLGQSNFKYLTYDPDSIKFYRSYNVLSRVKYNQGSSGRTWIDVEASKNLSPNFNIGFTIRRLTASRVLGAAAYSQKMVDHTAFSVFFNSSFFKNKYQILGSFSEMRHTIYETGGLFAKQSTPYDSLFNIETSISKFSASANGNERRRDFRLQNLFLLSKSFVIKLNTGFNVFKYSFSYDIPSNPFAAYESTFLNTQSTSNLFQYEFTYIKPAIEYRLNGYALQTSIDMRHHRYANEGLELNNTSEYLFETGLYKKLASGDIHLKFAFVPSRDKYFDINYTRSNFYVSASQSSISPSFMVSNLISNHYQWSNSFDLVNLKTINCSYSYSSNRLTLKPSIFFQSIINGIFYSENVVPIQFPRELTTLRFGLNANFDYHKFKIMSEFNYATSNNLTYLPQPKIFARISPFLLFKFRSGKFLVMPGIDVWYRDKFNGQAYDPTIGQFYLQSTQSTPSYRPPVHLELQKYIWSSVFVNFRINNTRGYVKYGNATQGFIGKGFMDVPYYPGQQPYFEFGVDWLFFD